MAFTLDPTLEADTIHLGDFPLCECRLFDNQTLPWIILVPRVEDVQELYELSDEMYQQCSTESLQVARILKSTFHADKMNIASIGNIVSQLHIHHIARYQNDPLWPNVVWGKLEANPYDDAALSVFKKQLIPYLQGFKPA